MEVNLQCPLNTLGYGLSSLNLLKAIAADGHAPALWPIGQPQAHPDDHKVIQDAINRTSSFNYTAPSVRIFHQFSLAERIGKGKAYGFPIFELNRFAKNEVHHLKSVDHLFVCSDWARKIMYTELNTEAVSVVPLGVDASIFHYVDTPVSDCTTFLNMGKWEVRKGHDILADAFNKAFGPNDNVKLILSCQNPFLNAQGNDEWARLYKTTPLGEKIFIVKDRFQTQQEVANLMQNVDCGVFPARAEGWGLETLEMMACGKQVITTNYSGHTEYCHSGNSLLVEFEKLEDAYDGIWFHGAGQWGSFGSHQIDQLVECLRHVHRLKQEKGVFVNTAGLDTAKHFSWNNSWKCMEAALCCN